MEGFAACTRDRKSCMDKRAPPHPPAEASAKAVSECIEHATLGAHSLESYEPLIGTEAVRRILAKAELLDGSRIAHISSTFYGGGVAEILTPLTLLMNTTG